MRKESAIFGRKEKEEAVKKKEASKTEPVKPKEEVDMAKLKEQALQVLFSQYEELIEQAQEIRKTDVKQGLKIIAQARAKLDRVEELMENKAPLIDELEEILGIEKETKTSGINVVSAENPEGKEIRFELAERLEYWREFYQKHNIDWVNLPETISISSEQAKEMQRQIKEYGFGYMMIIPENLVGENGEHYEELHKLMSEGYSETWQGSNYQEDGGLAGSRDKTTKLRIILTRKVKEINEDALFKQTIDKNVDQIEELAKEKSLTGLAESAYLIFQRDFFEETGQHLDCNYWTWLLESGRPASSRVPHVYWGSSTSQLGFYSSDRAEHDDVLGGRLSGSFILT